MPTSRLSHEFRQAIAAAAASRLVAAGYEAAKAADAVARRLEGVVFPGLEVPNPATTIEEIRVAIEGTTAPAQPLTPLEIARFHFDKCLAHCDEAGHAPEHAAEVLMLALLETG